MAQVGSGYRANVQILLIYPYEWLKQIESAAPGSPRESWSQSNCQSSRVVERDPLFTRLRVARVVEVLHHLARCGIEGEPGGKLGGQALLLCFQLGGESLVFGKLGSRSPPMAPAGGYPRQNVGCNGSKNEEACDDPLGRVG